MEKDGVVTKQMLKTKSGEFDLESIHSLVLRKLDIDNLGCLGECTALERLDLSYNDVTRLYALAGLTNLVNLNLSANRISLLEGLQSLDNLQSINLAGNLIGSVDTLKCLVGLEKLEDLRLKNIPQELSNPVCMNISYKSEVLRILPNLKILDGERLHGKGSELFKMCEELDKMIGEKETLKSAHEVPNATKWITNDFWVNKTAAQFEVSSLGDTEKQLEDLLAQCKQVTFKADEKIKTAAQVADTDSSWPIKL